MANNPSSEENLVVDRSNNNLKSPPQSPPVGTHNSYDFMQQAEMAAEAFAKQQMSGLSLNAADHVESSAGGNTVNTQDRMERRLRGSQGGLRDDVNSPISFQGGAPRQTTNLERGSRKNISPQQQQLFQSKKSYKQIGFVPPSTDGGASKIPKDYTAHNQVYFANKKTMRDVPGTNTLIMS